MILVQRDRPQHPEARLDVSSVLLHVPAGAPNAVATPELDRELWDRREAWAAV